MNETNKTLSETISEHLTESSEVYKQNELPPVELKATIPGLIDQKIELAHLYSEFRLSEQRVSNGIMNEMEPGARYIRDLNVRKIAIIREKFDRKFKDLLGVEDISELNDLDEAFAVLEEAGAANSENLTHWAVFLPKEGSEHRDHIALPVDGTKKNELHASKFKKVFGKNIADGYRLDRVELKETNEEVEQIDEMRVKVGPEQYHKGTDTVWHVVHHNGKEIGTVGTNAKEHHEKHGKWGFEDSRGSGRRNSQPKLNSKEQAVQALADRHKEYVAKETNEEVDQIGEAFVIHKGKHAAGETSSLAGQTHYGVEIKDVYADKKEAQAHADKLNQGRGYKPEDQKNPAVASALYQVSPKNTKRVPGVPLNAVFKINEKAPPGMEDWVKGRKEDFKERYGDRWEEVLYRTAWKMYNKKEEVEQIDDAFAVLEGQTPAERLRWAGARRIARQLIPGAGKRQARKQAEDERDQAYYAGQEYVADGGKRRPTKPGDDYWDTNTMANRHHKRADRWRKVAQGEPPFKEEVKQIDESWRVAPAPIRRHVDTLANYFSNTDDLSYSGKKHPLTPEVKGHIKFHSSQITKFNKEYDSHIEDAAGRSGSSRRHNIAHNKAAEAKEEIRNHRILHALHYFSPNVLKKFKAANRASQGDAIGLRYERHIDTAIKNLKAGGQKPPLTKPAMREEAEQIDEIKLKTAIRALHSMKDKGASPENTKRVNRMSNAIARKWGEKGAAVADKAVSDIDAKQASSGNHSKFFANDVLGRWRLRRHAADAEKAKLSDNRRIKTPNLPEEVEPIDELKASTYASAAEKRYKQAEMAKKLRLKGAQALKDRADNLSFGAAQAELNQQKKYLDKTLSPATKRIMSRGWVARFKGKVEPIDEESAHLTVTKLKSNGEHEQAGAAAFKHRLGRKYGPHFGLRSTKDKDEAAFHLGYDKAEMQSRKKVDEEVEQISGSVLSKLRAARAK
jgi:hypothetical protein